MLDRPPFLGSPVPIPQAVPEPVAPTWDFDMERRPIESDDPSRDETPIPEPSDELDARTVELQIIIMSILELEN
jgi:hypothetical protein